jgi:hypothetical protein
VEIVLSDEVLFMNGMTAQIFDVQGLLIKSVQLNNEIMQIDVSNLAKGFYIVKVGNDAKKLIVN